MPSRKFPLDTILGYFCLSLMLILLLVYLAYECGSAFKIGFREGSETAQRYPYATSIQLDRNDLTVPLADEPKIKSLFNKIIAVAKARHHGIPNIEVQFRFSFVPRDAPGFQEQPQGVWVASLVQKIAPGQQMRTDHWDMEHGEISTAVRALEGLLKKIEEKKRK